jgi:Mitochondrial carrier protein
MQLKQSSDVNQQYKGLIGGLQKIVKNEGLFGLYKGLIRRFSLLT